MKLNAKAQILRANLFRLIQDFSDLQLEVSYQHSLSLGKQMEAWQQVTAGVTGLTQVYESLGDLFIDAMRDVRVQHFVEDPDIPFTYNSRKHQTAKRKQDKKLQILRAKNNPPLK